GGAVAGCDVGSRDEGAVGEGGRAQAVLAADAAQVGGPGAGAGRPALEAGGEVGAGDVLEGHLASRCRDGELALGVGGVLGSDDGGVAVGGEEVRSEEHTSELQS